MKFLVVSVAIDPNDRKKRPLGHAQTATCGP
jgi:hypothetical protein